VTVPAAGAWLDQASAELGEPHPHPRAHPVAWLAWWDRLLAHAVATGRLRRVVHPAPVTIATDGTATTVGRGQLAAVVEADGRGTLVVVVR